MRNQRGVLPTAWGTARCRADGYRRRRRHTRDQYPRHRKESSDGTAVPPAGGEHRRSTTHSPYCNEPVGGAGAAETFTLTTGSTGDWSDHRRCSRFRGFHRNLPPRTSRSKTRPARACLPRIAACTIDVEFTPTAAGLRSAALTATDRRRRHHRDLRLAGTTTSGLAFEFVEPGTNPATLARSERISLFCNEPPSGSTPRRSRSR